MAKSEKKSGLLVGVDLGGTKIMAGVFDADLELLGTAKISTKPQRGPEAIIDRVARCVRDALDECDLDLKAVRAIGIGAPGSVNPDTGKVLFAPNLGWENVDLGKSLGDSVDVPVRVENDCTLSTLGVYEKELKAKPRHMVGIFIGTGIGGGLILNGELYSGFNRTAGEIGHMIIQVDGPRCSCGNRGCFEALASRNAIFNRIVTAVKQGQQTLLTSMLGDKIDDLRSGKLRKAIRRGDEFVSKVVSEAAQYTGIAVANIMNLLNPEVVVLGGGIIEALDDEMMPIITKVARANALRGTAQGISVIASKLGDNAGIVGGAVLARRHST